MKHYSLTRTFTGFAQLPQCIKNMAVPAVVSIRFLFIHALNPFPCHCRI